MRDFFRGWKRKAGCATLVMACMFVAGWLRSFEFYDKIILSTGFLNKVSLNSLLGYTALRINPMYQGNFPRIESMTKSFFVGPQESEEAVVCDILALQWMRYGFYCGVPDDKYSKIIIVVPYWSIVVPLTLLSACLLFSKPGPSAPKQTAEPAPTTSA